MTTRYQQLRQVVANLAAAPEEQVRYLDDLFTPLTGGGSAAAYPNDELALELEDVVAAANDMIEHGELTEGEWETVRPLVELFEDKWSDPAFWRREALFDDARWGDVRACAAGILALLLDEQREVGRCAR